MKVIIIDASVAAKWLLPDEQDVIALKIKDDFKHRNVYINVPITIFLEINNLLKSAYKSKRINYKQAINLNNRFLNLEFVVHSSKNLMKMTLQVAASLDISSYDASYIALAQSLNFPFTLQIKNSSKKLKIPLLNLSLLTPYRYQKSLKATLIRKP